MEIKMNNLVLYIIGIQIVLCLIVSIIGSFWYRENEDDILYLPFTFAVGLNGVITFFTHFLLFNTLLPISLIVTLEIAKVVQSFFIMGDADMYSLERDRAAKVASTSIIEELGQVDYIFSDKTGTLTRNVMEFKLLYVGADLYGNPRDLETTLGVSETNKL
jgi:P-type E1-E2 ATPase